MANTNKSKQSSSTNAKSTNKQKNAMKKIGQGMKDLFIEMSESLAGWIDDTGEQFSKKKKQQKQCSQKSGQCTNNCAEKPKPEPGMKK